MIPRIIHQTWRTPDVPAQFRGFQRSLRDLHPAWEYRFWDDAANEQLIADHYPEFLQYFRTASPAILKIDLVRLAYLHRHGGVYADLDCEALRPLEPLTIGSRIVVGRESGGIGRRIRGRDYIINAMIISPIGHPVWLKIMGRMVAEYRARRRFERHIVHVIRMGIAVFDEELEKQAISHDDVSILGHEAFYPASPADRRIESRRHLGFARNSFVIHHYENSWFDSTSLRINQARDALQRWIPRSQSLAKDLNTRHHSPPSPRAVTGSQLTVGFDGTCLPNLRGFGRFARGILAGLAATNPGHRLEVVVDRRSADSVIVPEGVLLKVVNARQTRSEAAEDRSSRSLADMWSLSRAVHAARYDVFYFPTSMTFFPQSPWRKTVLTMHDTLGVERPELVFATVASRWLWWVKEQAARWNVSVLTTVSEAARADLSRYYRIPAERIEVLAEGLDSIFMQADDALPPWPRVARKYGVPEHGRFWLTVGSPLPNKNLSRLIEAYAGLPDDIGPLVLVGAVDGECELHVARLRAEAASRGVEQRVLFAGFLPDDELAVLYRRATSLIFPSLWEGFGLPAVEAMVSGLPVLYSRAGALPEVVGDAGVMFDPLSVADLRSAWGRVAGDDSLRADMSRRGLEYGRRYRWEAAGEQLWRVLEQAAGTAP